MFQLCRPWLGRTHKITAHYSVDDAHVWRHTIKHMVIFTDCKGRHICLKIWLCSSSYWFCHGLPVTDLPWKVTRNVTLIRAAKLFDVFFKIAHNTIDAKCRVCGTFRVNSQSRGKYDCNRKLIIFKHISKIGILRISCETPLRWMSRDIIDN